MENYFLGVLGIIVSVILFFLGYRQTIGAKKERIKVANQEIEKILVRRIVIETFTPKIEDISRIIEGKARDYRVDIDDLLSESQTLNTIYTRIIETDFITQEQREKIINRINAVLVKSESKPIEEETLEFTSRKENIVTKLSLPIILAIVTSTLGVFITLFPELQKINEKESSTEFFIFLVATIIVSFSVIMFLFIIRKYKDNSVESSKTSSISKFYELEREVGRSLQKMGFKIMPSDNHSYAYLIEKEDKKIIIDVKNWSTRIPLVILKRVIYRLYDLIKKGIGQEAFIVTPNQTFYPKEILENIPIKIMSLRELRNYLVH